MAAHPPPPRASWRAGHPLGPGGRTRLLLLAGAGSRTGDADRAFAPLGQYLARHGGYDARHDLLEASYAGSDRGGRWWPRPYLPADTRRPLLDSADAVARTLDWYRAALPEATRFCLVGYSLGGVAAFDGATMALARDRAAWRGRIKAIITLASPLRGCNAGPLMQWAWLVTNELDPLGSAGPDLDQRWTDPEEQARVERRARFLRDAGVTLLTLADPDDAVVRPEEALLPAPGQSTESLLVRARSAGPVRFGHGAILGEPTIWRRILDVVGPQEPLSEEERATPGGSDPLDDELKAIRQRLRAQGRIR